MRKSKYLRLLTLLSIAIAGFASSNAAFANCDEVLRDGIKSSTKFRSSNTYDLAVYNEFLRSTFSNSKSNSSLSLGVPITDQVMGTADYNEDDYDLKKARISRIMSTQVRETSLTQFALSSGDKTITDAWVDCKLKSGGYLSLNVRRPSATDAVLTLQWHSGNSTITQTTLLDDIYVGEENRILQSERCMKAGYILANGVPCSVRLSLPRAESDLLVVANTENGTSEAYIPPKMKMVREVRSYPFVTCEGPPPINDPEGKKLLNWAKTCPFRLVGSAKRSAFDHSHTVYLDEKLIEAGWAFDSASFHMDVAKKYGGSGKTCTMPKVSKRDHQITYGYKADSRGGDRNASVICVATPTVDIERYRLVPDT